MKDRVQLLIDILLDKTAREDEREDAAMDLSKYADKRVLNALLQIASDTKEDNSFLTGDCAESFGEICVRMHWFDPMEFKKLIPFAQKIVFHQIMASKPELINPMLREELLDLYPLQ